jgi:pimeloyl-ACP methyl ester carboxylesterase
LSEPVEGFTRIGKYSFHHVQWGRSGKNLVLLHSMGVDAYSMDLFAESVASDHRVLALTILGHGDSTMPQEKVSLPDHADLLWACVRKLGYTPCVLVGHSIGGRLSMILAAEHPNDVRGVVLVDIAPPDPVPRPWAQQAPPPLRNVEEAAAYVRQRYPGFTAHYVENRLNHGFRRAPDGSLVAKPAGNEQMRDMTTDLWPYVERMRAPTLLIIGSESTLVTPEKVERMRGSIQRFESVTVRGASHMVPQDTPAEFEEEVRGFLGRIGW